MSITIRLAEPADAEIIAGLSRETFYDTFAAFNTQENMDKFMTERFSKAKLMQEVNEPGNIFLMAYADKELVGYARMRESETPVSLASLTALEIARIYSIQKNIGRGVGSALMQRCIEIAHAKGKEVLWLGVWEHNQRAIDFYIKWGFEKFGDHPFILGRDIQNDWLMKKLLAVSY